MRTQLDSALIYAMFHKVVLLCSLSLEIREQFVCWGYGFMRRMVLSEFVVEMRRNLKIYCYYICSRSIIWRIRNVL